MTLFAWLAGFSALPVLQKDTLAILTPSDGDAIQGVVQIQGTTDVPGFQSAEVLFAYQNDPTSTWFLIQQDTSPVKAGLLASWDTTTISDAEYRLRVRVVLADGKELEAQVANLRVRNYTPVETSTPDILALRQQNIPPTETPRPDYQPIASTPELLPTNPAQLTPQNLRDSALRGIGLVIVIFIAGGLYWGFRVISRH